MPVGWLGAAIAAPPLRSRRFATGAPARRERVAAAVAGIGSIHAFARFEAISPASPFSSSAWRSSAARRSSASNVAAETWWALGWWGVGTLGAGSALWYSGLDRAESTTAAGFMSVMALSALLLSYFLLGETFEWIHVPGVVLVLTSIGLMSWVHASDHAGKGD